MRIHLFTVGLTLALLAVACGSPAASSAGATTCTGPSGNNRVYIVVEHLSGATMQRCVGFATSIIDGQTAMDQSGIEYQAHAVSAGKVVCQVDFEPKQFSQCFPQNQPYWALFVESGGRWSNAPGGLTDLHLHDQDAIGWHYVGATDPAPAPPPLARES
jgi:hypothetical protein